MIKFIKILWIQLNYFLQQKYHLLTFLFVDISCLLILLYSLYQIYSFTLKKVITVITFKSIITLLKYNKMQKVREFDIITG